MSVVGIDYGNLSALIALAGKGGVDVILNDSSNRQTATYVSIQGKQRFLGDAAASMARSNVANTIACMKLLVGRKFDSADVQLELSKAPFNAVKLSDGGIGIKTVYKDKDVVFPVEQVMAMMLVKAKEIAVKANSNIDVAEAVLAVPNWYTDSQRRGVLNACKIASLNCLKVTNESNAIALSYGIFKSAKNLFSPTEPTHIMFIDIGYTGYSVSIVDFIQENMKVLSTVCDRRLGGRDFDDVIVEFLIETFKAKTGIDVRGNWKAILKLQAAAEKAKKTLSPAGVNEASVSVECLAEEKDLSVMLTRDEFERRAAPLVARLEAPITQCLAEAKLTREQITEVEIVGGSTRVNIIKRVLGEILGLDPAAMNYGLKTTMNSDEAVARGSALQCALLSARLRVKTFNILDTLAYGIVARFESPGSSAETAAMDGDSKEDLQARGSSAVLYSRGDEVPHKPRRLTFRNKSSDFEITLTYDDAAALPDGEDRVVAKYLIKVPPALAASHGDVRVTFNIDKHGCVVLASAQFMKEVVEEAPAPVGEGKEEEGKVDAMPKKKFKKTDLDVVTEAFGLTKEDINKALESEAEMAYEDRLLTETADKRNELEAYIYGMRNKLDGVLKGYYSQTEKDTLSSRLDASEDWLYGDGFDVSKQEYIRKLEELRAVGDPIEARLAEHSNRPAALESLRKQIEMVKVFSSNYDDAHAHITEEERARLRDAASAAEAWLFDSQSKQGDIPQNADPVLTVDMVSKKRTELFNVSNPIVTKPKPKPAPAPTPAAENKDSKDGPAGEADAGAAMDQDPAPSDEKQDAGDSKSTGSESAKMET